MSQLEALVKFVVIAFNFVLRQVCVEMMATDYDLNCIFFSLWEINCLSYFSNKLKLFVFSEGLSFLHDFVFDFLHFSFGLVCLIYFDLHKNSSFPHGPKLRIIVCIDLGLRIV